HQALYEVALSRDDLPGMEKQMLAVKGSAFEPWVLGEHADYQALHGQLRSAERTLAQYATVQKELSAEEAGIGGAFSTLEVGLYRAEYGQPAEGMAAAERALTLSPEPGVAALGSLVYARSGDSIKALALVQSLRSKFPLDPIAEYLSDLINGAVA